MEPRKAIYMPVAIVRAMTFLLIVSSVALAGQSRPAKVERLPWPKLTLDSADRVLILAPHPDDEVLAFAQRHAGPVPCDWTLWRILAIVHATAQGN